MMTLHDTIEMTKKVALFGVLAIVGIFIIIMLFRLGGFLKERLFPTPAPAPLIGFGKLPVITFKESEEAGDYTYVLDTITGKLPVVKDREDVYKIIKPLPEFYDLTRAKSYARENKFITPPNRIKENVYQWTETVEPKRQLYMDIVSKDFFLASTFLTYQPIALGQNRPDPQTAIKESVKFLASLNSYPNTINEASTAAKLLAIQNGKIVQASSLQNTQLIRVDFYQHEVNTLPIYYPDFPNSLIYTIVGGGLTRPTIVEAKFNDQIISEEHSDYPIKTAEEAYKELETGNAYIASYFSTQPEVHIRNIQLGYYLGEIPQEYLMPIFVFTGDNGFTAYVSAVENDFIQ